MLAKISLACLLGLAAEAKKHMTLAQLVAESQQCCCDNDCCDEPEEEPVEPIIELPVPEPIEPIVEVPEIDLPVYPTTVESLPPSPSAFDELIGNSPDIPIVLDFQYDACDPCQRIAPDFEALKDANPNVIFRKVDIYDHRDLLEQLGVVEIPTFKIFVNAEL